MSGEEFVQHEPADGSGRADNGDQRRGIGGSRCGRPEHFQFAPGEPAMSQSPEHPQRWAAGGTAVRRNWSGRPFIAQGTMESMSRNP